MISLICPILTSGAGGIERGCMKRRLETLLTNETTAWIVLAVTIAMTVLAWSVADKYRKRGAEQRFSETVMMAQENIQERMDDYQEILRAGAGLFNGSEDVTREEWKSFVGSMNLAVAYPGIQGLGYATIFPASEKKALERKIRNEGFPDFSIRPAGARPEYSAIIYLEPFNWRNRRAFGYDMFSEPVRRKAMEEARDTGRIVMSGHVTLVQETSEDVQSGCLMYMPIYRRGQVLKTVEDRRAALLGYVYAVFRIGDLMQAIQGDGIKQLNFDLYDGARLNDDDLIFRALAVVEHAAGARQAGQEPRKANWTRVPQYTADTPLEIAGRTWTARFSSSPYFEESLASSQPTLIAFGGLLADSLLFAVLFTVSRSGRILAGRNEELAASQDALIREKNRYAVLVENVPGMVFRCGVTPPWPVRFVSRRVADLCGVDAEAFTSGHLNFESCVHPDDLARIEQEIEDEVKAGRPYEIEFRFRHADGSYRWFSAHGAAHYGTDGKPQWLDGVVFDITERKRLEKRFNQVVEAAPLAMVVVDTEGRMIMVNTALERLFGYGRHELLSHKVEMLLPERMRDRHVELHRDFLSEPDARQVGTGRDLRGVCKDGREVAVEVGLSPIETETGKYVLAVIADITERQRSLEALQERELRYRTVVETTPDGFWLVDRTGKLTAANEAYGRMSGYRQEELVGMRIPDLEANEKPEDTAAHIAMVYEQGHDRFETVHRRKDGSLWPAEITVSLIPQLGDMFVFIRDLSEIKALEAERARTEEQIRRQAFLDPLTQLPNRRLLTDRLRQALAAGRRNRRYGAVLFVDMDNFKLLNDSLGHEMGDQLLIQVAQRLKGCVRAEDTVARLGGDEFVVMLDGLSEDAEQSMHHARQAGEHILDVLNRNYRLGTHDYHSTPSIGATLFLDDKEGVDAIFRRADSAMYQAKSSGRNALRFFDADVEGLMSDRQRLEACLNGNEPGNELLLHYQPLLDQEGRLVGAEALVRWQHPTHGLLEPAAFLDLAEESGFAIRLGRRVLSMACERLAAWSARPELKHLDLTVNLSVKHLRQSGFVDEVSGVLAESGADPRRLIFELGEGLLMHRDKECLKTISALKELGIRFSLDNFGSCYFSMGAMLKAIPFDQLKLEQSCLPDIAPDTPGPGLVQALVDLGHSLGPKVVAKGVETEMQWNFLRDLGCGQAQGFLFGRPVTAEELERVWGNSNPP